MTNKIIQFQGEERRDCIVNHFSLDIVDEKAFFEYVEKMGYTIDDSDEIIISLFKMFLKQQP